MIATRLAAVSILAMGLSLAGCSVGDGAPNASVDAGDAPGTIPAPDFVGPYADDYRQVWTETDSAFVHGVINDEQITEQEWAEVTSRLSDCLGENGIIFLGFESDGSYTADAANAGDRADEIAGTCEAESGSDWIGYLRQMQVANPENRDINEIMAECLVRDGAVAPGYTADDYRDDVVDLSFPYLDSKDGPKVFAACNSDPLSLLADE